MPRWSACGRRVRLIGLRRPRAPHGEARQAVGRRRSAALLDGGQEAPGHEPGDGDADQCDRSADRLADQGCPDRGYRAGGCKILHLFLNELTLHLLGANAHLDKVQLGVTGNAHGGVLGSLFCRLADAKVASTRAGIARAMTTAVRHDAGHVVRFTANLTPQATTTAAGPTCSVLDLVVGPLDVQLLGFQVDLNRVHLVVTATRGAGMLGDVFCTLADNNPAPTTP